MSPLHLGRLFTLAIAVVFAATGSGSRPRSTSVTAAEPAAKAAAASSALGQEVIRRLADLNSDDYVVRQQAQDRLQVLSRQPDAQPLLATECRRILTEAKTSLEVRETLELLVAGLPTKVIATEMPAPAVNADAALAELDALVRDLDGNSYAGRVGAAARLKFLATRPETAAAAMTRLKHRLADATLSHEGRQQIQRLWELARGVWLLGDPTAATLPEVTAAQIEGWLDDLTRPTPKGFVASDWIVHKNAERELLDALARDDVLAQVKAALEKRLAEGQLPDDAQVRLTNVLDWTRPAMTAEFWQSGRHLGIQHMIVGVPHFPQGARRASHFDSIDDQTAHCVSGNSLSPGDYPVGVFFPHPLTLEACFQLVNLPTPRKRMAYEYYVKRDESLRRAEISQRTLASLTAQNRILSDREIDMLRYLDPNTVSRFAGPYFLAQPDQATGAEGDFDPYGRSFHASRHGRLCYVLCQTGTREAIPGLLKAIEADRFAAPSRAAAPYKTQWLAVLAIAARDPWPGVDDWLANHAARLDPLSINRPDQSPQLGATAAAILLERHSASPATFGIEPDNDNVIDSSDVLIHAQFGVPGYRYSSAEKPAAVLRWWSEIKSRLASDRAG